MCAHAWPIFSAADFNWKAKRIGLDWIGYILLEKKQQQQQFPFSKTKFWDGLPGRTALEKPRPTETQFSLMKVQCRKNLNFKFKFR